MNIKRYSDEYFVPLVCFLKQNWSPSHILYDKSVYDWQYNTQDREICSLLAFEKDKIVGFLGNIPNTYFVNNKKNLGIGLTMWIIDIRLRNSGLGIILMQEAERIAPVSLTLGCGLNVVPLYQRMEYSYISKLNRYVVPIDKERYPALCAKGANPSELDVWYEFVFRRSVKLIPPNQNVSSEELASLYEKSIFPSFRFFCSRDAEFWDWRYKNSAGYRYLFFGNPLTTGIIVARVERVIAEDNADLNGAKVFRIIEIIPAETAVWHGRSDGSIIDLLSGAVLWAREQGCIAADYQSSNNRLSAVLAEVGFREQKAGYEPDLLSLAELFQPLRPLANPINFAWKIRNDKEEKVLIDANDTYFVKSDCDMDRPNKWPLPVGWQ